MSKVLPSRAKRAQTVAACAESLERLRTHYLDLYLLHWREDPGGSAVSCNQLLYT